MKSVRSMKITTWALLSKVAINSQRIFKYIIYKIQYINNR